MSLQGSKLLSMPQHPPVMEEQVILSLSTTLLGKELSLWNKYFLSSIFVSDHESVIST